MLAARPALIGRVGGIAYHVIAVHLIRQLGHAQRAPAQEVDQAAADLAAVKSLAVELAREMGRLSFLIGRERPLSRG